MRRDGLELVSYLTLPADIEGDRPPRPLPMVLIVHGGPWGRDIYGYRRDHQWLADRGYAVLSVNYRGSIATFFYNRQGVGTYKCCSTVYGAPTRNYNFDSDFLDPSKLPPNTPVFRDMNAVGFSQELRPGK